MDAVLHRGICSTVYEVNGKVVKAYHKDLLQPRHRLNISREIAILETLKELRVPGVVELSHTCEDAANIFLVFQPCCDDLYQRLAQHGLLTEDSLAAQVVVPLLRVLAHLHRLGIVHRDVKPENIFFAAAGGGLVLGDFGLAVAVGDRPVSRVGTLPYMAAEVLAQPSPEALSLRSLAGQPLALAPYGTKADVWAVGVLVQESLTGSTPFGHAHPELVSLRAQFKPPAPLGPGVSAACRDFVASALTKAPAERPSALELLSHPWLLPHLGPADFEALGKGGPARSVSGSLSAAVATAAPTSCGRPSGNEPLLVASGLDTAEAAHRVQPVLLPMRSVTVRPQPLAACCSWSPASAAASPDTAATLAGALCRADSEPVATSPAHKNKQPAAASQFRSPTPAAAAMAAAAQPGGGGAVPPAKRVHGFQVLLQPPSPASSVPRPVPQARDAAAGPAAVPALFAGQLQVPALLLLSPSPPSSSRKPWPFSPAGTSKPQAPAADAASAPSCPTGLAAATAVLLTQSLARRGLWVQVPTMLAGIHELPSPASAKA